jgi:hypothetical protein
VLTELILGYSRFEVYKVIARSWNFGSVIERKASMSEREKFSAFLFGRDDTEVLDIKFLRGTSPALTPDEMCETARGVLTEFFERGGSTNVLPVGRRPQRGVAEILGFY